MAIFKCKMCGGTLDINNNETVAVCEYCGSKQTVPTQSNEVITNLFNRANNLRLKNEFDKAAEIYGKILDENDTNSEAHWCLLLCKYGIEYVEDPKTYKRIPTCHRAQYTSVLTDPDYLAAVENADVVSKEVYAEQAHEISELQKSILAIVKNEKPFDVFICYKESDENGKRTVDSALANDIYYQLTKEGLRVFYAAITLEDKLGQEYEPYIFAALNTAKVMLVIGTKPEYFEAVWVRNEWSRFLALMKTDRNKMLIPCYRDMDAYELPEEFAHLQAQDMAKIGFINDLVRGIKKVTAKDEPKPEQQTVIQQVGSAGNMQALLKRGYMALEDHEWDRADGFFEEVLNLDAECAEAYLGQLLAKNKLTSLKAYANHLFSTRIEKAAKKGKKSSLTPPKTMIDEAVKKYSIPNYFSSDEINKLYKSIVVEYVTFYGDVNRLASELKKDLKTDNLLNKAKRFAKGDLADGLAKTQQELFDKVDAYLTQIKAKDEKAHGDAEEKYAAGLADVQAKIETFFQYRIKRREADYVSFCQAMETADTIEQLNDLLGKFRLLGNYKDSAQKAVYINNRIREKQEAERLEAERKKEAERLEAERKKEAERIATENAIKRRKGGIAIAVLTVLAGIVCLIVVVTVIIPNNKYNKAIELMSAGNTEAYSIFLELGDFKDAPDKRAPYMKSINIKTISAGQHHTVGLKSDGTVVAVGDNDFGECEVSGWTDIVSVAEGYGHTVGLKNNGTVVAVGSNSQGGCDVSGWTDIVAVVAGNHHTVGLKNDGTVVATEYTGHQEDYDGQCEVSKWKKIIAVAAGDGHTVGLKSDGTVVATEYTGSMLDYAGQCDVSGWTDIVAVAAGYEHTVGLKKDGTVVATEYTGDHYDGECGVSGWTDIVAVAAGYNHTVGLKSDGTVVAVGNNSFGQCEVSGWTDIVAVAAGWNHTVGLKSDGTVVTVGSNFDGQCDVSGWKDIMIPQQNKNN